MRRLTALLLCLSVFLSGCGYTDSYVESVREESYNKGYEEGREAGYSSGCDDGYREALSEYENDWAEGYEEGFFDAFHGNEPQFEINVVEDPGYNNGSLTKDQVIELQKYYGLAPDGYWGPKSQDAAGSADYAWKEYQEAKTSFPVINPSPTPIPTPTPEPSVSYTVYVANTGDKFHLYGCQYLRQSCIPISLDVAVSIGYTACSRCW